MIALYYVPTQWNLAHSMHYRPGLAFNFQALLHRFQYLGTRMLSNYLVGVLEHAQTYGTL